MDEFREYSLWARVAIVVTCISLGVGAIVTVVHLATQPAIQNQEFVNKQMNPAAQEALRASIGRVKNLQAKIVAAQAKLATETGAQKKVEIGNQIVDWNTAITALEVEIGAQITTAKSAGVVLPNDIADYKQSSSAQPAQ